MRCEARGTLGAQPRALVVLFYKRTCPWVKPDGKPQYSGDRPGIGYESIVACHAPGRSTWNGGGSHGVFIVNLSAAREQLELRV